MQKTPVTTETQTRFAEALKALYEQEGSTEAIRTLDELAAALDKAGKSFSPDCEKSRQLVGDMLQVLNPYAASAAMMAPTFVARSRQYKLNRGHRQYKAKPPPAKPERPVLRRIQSC